jgi:lipid-A-disaccharide synthase
VPEFVQEQATPGALANALLDLLHDAGAQRRQIEKFHDIHVVLRQNTAQKAADAVLGVIDAHAR